MNNIFFFILGYICGCYSTDELEVCEFMSSASTLMVKVKIKVFALNEPVSNDRHTLRLQQKRTSHRHFDLYHRNEHHITDTKKKKEGRS